MARSLGPRLTADLLARLSQADLVPLLGRVLPLITVDADGRPHPMLCSYLELRAVDAGTIRVAIGAGSGSARNLTERGVATLLLVEAGRAVYVKCRATGPAVERGMLARFELAVLDVLEDAAAGWEGDAGITGGITYGPVPDLGQSWARELLALLAE